MLPDHADYNDCGLVYKYMRRALRNAMGGRDEHPVRLSVNNAAFLQI
jgi:hypothetical protein